MINEKGKCKRGITGELIRHSVTGFVAPKTFPSAGVPGEYVGCRARLPNSHNRETTSGLSDVCESSHQISRSHPPDDIHQGGDPLSLRIVAHSGRLKKVFMNFLNLESGPSRPTVRPSKLQVSGPKKRPEANRKRKTKRQRNKPQNVYKQRKRRMRSRRCGTGVTDMKPAPLQEGSDFVWIPRTWNPLGGVSCGLVIAHRTAV